MFYDPKHPYTWALLSSLPQLGVKGEDLYSIKGTPPNLFHPLHPYTRALLSAIPMPDPESEREKVLEVYDPSCHHYETDKPVWTEIEPGHFIMANQEELEKYRAQLVHF